MEVIKITSTKRCEMIDITEEIKGVISKNNWNDGVLVAFSMHTTGALTINESYDPDVQGDLMRALKEMVPNVHFNHMEGNSDAHLKTSLVGTDVTLIIEGGRPVLGTWQGIYFCEFDGGRERKVALKFIGK